MTSKTSIYKDRTQIPGKRCKVKCQNLKFYSKLYNYIHLNNKVIKKNLIIKEIHVIWLRKSVSSNCRRTLWGNSTMHLFHANPIFYNIKGYSISVQTALQNFLIDLNFWYFIQLCLHKNKSTILCYSSKACIHSIPRILPFRILAILQKTALSS